MSARLAAFQFIERQEELCSGHMVIGATEQILLLHPDPLERVRTAHLNLQ